MVGAVEMSAAEPIPAHVPTSLVYDFDLFADPGMSTDPHERIREMVRDAPPICWTPRRGGLWLILGHKANFEAARDWDIFTSHNLFPEELEAMRGMMPQGAPHIPQAIPITLDPPDHTKYRAPLNAAFGPKAIAALQDDIRALADELIDKVAQQGHCEAIEDIAEQMPVRVFLKMMGLPLEGFREYRTLVREALASIGYDPLESAINMVRIAASMRDTMEERRQHPRDDLISLLWQTEIDGKPTTWEDMENYGVLLFIGGLDTVMNGMGYGLRHLAKDQSLQARLRQNPKEIGEAVEELLRRYTFTIPARRVAKDTMFQGVEMKRGDRALMFLPAADLDPEEFPEPQKFDLDRENKVHIAFNSGPHRCIGSHLARVELQVLYEEIISRLPPFRLDPKKPPTFHGGNVVGIDTLNLVWDL